MKKHIPPLIGILILSPLISLSLGINLKSILLSTISITAGYILGALNEKKSK